MGLLFFGDTRKLHRFLRKERIFFIEKTLVLLEKDEIYG
jgi:hypothetical protein